ncbi:hypothetical protein HMPREF1869_01478 [Bacteroidales bacterium KA00251]|nr:hypothetical protein HMPREF1869_01478 [Bacteroidales bacterium KA00251]
MLESPSFKHNLLRGINLIAKLQNYYHLIGVQPWNTMHVERKEDLSYLKKERNDGTLKRMYYLCKRNSTRV